MHKKRIVITGGPGTGKSSVVDYLESLGFECLHEVSREIIAKAQKEGIEQLFLKDPILFSEKILESRILQHKEAEEREGRVFIDRGVPDVVAYMDYLGTSYPSIFIEACKKYQYDLIFLLPPWSEIYKTDNERYESFEQAGAIHDYLKKTYLKFGYQTIEVPKASVENRTKFIIKHLGD